MQSGSSGMRVFDPRGGVVAAAMHCAPRAKELAGKRLAILDNTKWNANKLLRGTRDKLVAQEQFGSVTYYRKESFSSNAAPALIDEIVANNDVVLTAIGD
ncbi:MAG: hypothetical protein EXR39_18050 [Betaproteobacteria bacterium]|nr:hypothetical protein [Betaproteobacteria bacterium]